MRYLLIVGAAAMGLAAQAQAGDVPAEASADLAFSTNLPGERDAAFTAPASDRAAKRPVDGETAAELRRLAIEEFGQASSRSEGSAETNGGPPAGVASHADGVFARVERRGVDVSSDQSEAEH